MTQQKILIKWAGKDLECDIALDSTVGQLKRELQSLTQVDPKRQKLLGLKTKDGKPASDDACIADLAIKPNTKVMMMGQPEAVIAATDAATAAAAQPQDDFDAGAEEDGALDVKDRPEVQEKLQRRIASVDVKIITPPRPGKKCLVLDIDYTLFDLNSSAERADELARPYLHAFLAACHDYYDVIIWSATSMKWVEVKMRELGVLGNPAYGIVCLLDHQAMVTVHTERYGVFDCKPLAFIWAKFPEQYHPENTIMLDDLRRNYVMNKQQGLVIRPFKRAHLNRDTDDELLRLGHYLCLIGERASLADLDHRRWERHLAKYGGWRALPGAQLPPPPPRETGQQQQQQQAAAEGGAPSGSAAAAAPPE